MQLRTPPGIRHMFQASQLKQSHPCETMEGRNKLHSEALLEEQKTSLGWFTHPTPWQQIQGVEDVNQENDRGLILYSKGDRAEHGPIRPPWTGQFLDPPLHELTQRSPHPGQKKEIRENKRGTSGGPTDDARFPQNYKQRNKFDHHPCKNVWLLGRHWAMQMQRE